MSFADSLKRLETAAGERQRGISQDQCVVRRQDLQELLHHFYRLDDAARAEYLATKI